MSVSPLSSCWGNDYTLFCSQGVLKVVLVGQLFIMPRVIELCLSGSLGFFHWYCRAREEGAVSQEGEKFESVLHSASGSLVSVVLTLSRQPCFAYRPALCLVLGVASAIARTWVASCLSPAHRVPV